MDAMRDDQWLGQRCLDAEREEKCHQDQPPDGDKLKAADRHLVPSIRKWMVPPKKKPASAWLAGFLLAWPEGQFGRRA